MIVLSSYLSKLCYISFISFIRKDNEGQTPLHYAAVCEREDIAEYLVKQNADSSVKDNDGNTPRDLCDSNWPWMHCASK